MKRPRTPEDKGEPGKFYFEEPVTVSVPGKKSSVMMLPHSSNNGNTMAESRPFYLIPGRCRLESSHKLHGYNPPENIVYELSNYPQPHQIPEFLRKASIAGFGEGSIVCRRYQNPGRWKYCHQWGMIIIVHPRISLGSRYCPFTVKWFSDAHVESAWPEDLVVVHSNMDLAMLKDIMESQDVAVEDVT